DSILPVLRCRHSRWTHEAPELHARRERRLFPQAERSAAAKASILRSTEACTIDPQEVRCVYDKGAALFVGASLQSDARGTTLDHALVISRRDCQHRLPLPTMSRCCPGEAFPRTIAHRGTSCFLL